MKRLHILLPIAIGLAVLALYGWFLQNPWVFDDIVALSPERLPLGATSSLNPRYLSYLSHALVWRWSGESVVVMRAMSLLLHAAVAISLFYFLLQLSRACCEAGEETSPWMPLLAALAFALHPAAVYGAAYLNQRSIVMATLFSIWSWMCLLRWLKSDQLQWLLCSVLAYGLAMLSKEHAVMTPAVSGALMLWWYRTNGQGIAPRALVVRVLPAFLACAVIAAWAISMRYAIIGNSEAEPSARMMMQGISGHHPLLLNALTQGSLFFKYLLLWLVPNPLWMSIDIRESFAVGFTDWPHVFGFCVFLTWPFLSLRLLWVGGRTGLLGFAMLAPWLLFATELSSIRIQEIFVLYRSYLWIVPACAAFITLAGLLRDRVVTVLLIFVPLLLSGLAWSRLATFSSSFWLWDDALRLAQTKGNPAGIERIYLNRAVELHRLHRYDLAIQDFSSALAIRPDYSPAFGGRASAYAEAGHVDLALVDFDRAINIDPKVAVYYVNKATALASTGRRADADETFRRACQLGWKTGCIKVSAQRETN